MGRGPCGDKNGLKKGPWTPEEDQKLIDYIQKHGYGNWRTLPKNAGLQRCGKSCRLRWTNYLRPDIKRGRFSFQEEDTIIHLHSILGNRWSAMAARLPGRTDNEIKNYWNTHIRKRLLRMGIDPITHSPRLDLLDLSSLLGSSLYGSSHLRDMSRLFGFPPLGGVNPELLQLATSSLMPSEPEIGLPQMRNLDQSTGQYQQLVEPNQFQTKIMPSTLTAPNMFVPFSSNETHFVDPNDNENGFVNSNLMSYYYGSDQAEILDQSISETTSNFMSNNSNHNLGLASVLSTPSSSSTPLDSTSNSNSTHINCSNTSIDDERDSYCSNIFEF